MGGADRTAVFARVPVGMLEYQAPGGCVNEPDMHADLPAVAVCREGAWKHDFEEMMARVADAMDRKA